MVVVVVLLLLLLVVVVVVASVVITLLCHLSHISEHCHPVRFTHNSYVSSSIISLYCVKYCVGIYSFIIFLHNVKYYANADGS